MSEKNNTPSDKNSSKSGFLSRIENFIPFEKIVEILTGYRHEDLLKSKVVISRLELITPETARKYLNLMTSDDPDIPANRRLTQHRVDEYAEQIRNGLYRIIHQGIAFDLNGRLIDGQHRLHAIIQAGKPVIMMVTYGIQPEASVNIDQNKPRRAPDFLHMTGYKHSHLRIGVASRIACGIKRNKGANIVAEPVLLLHDKHKAAINFVFDHAVKKNRGIGSAAVLSVFCRAYYTQDHEKIAIFMKILNTGVAPEKYPIDHSILEQIVKLRDYLTSYNAGRGKGQSNDMVMEYAKTQMVLWAFLNNYTGNLKPLMETTVFPIPDDKHYPEILGYSLDETHIDHDQNGDGLWDSENTTKKEIAAFVSLWHETYGDAKVFSVDLLKLAFDNGFFDYLKQYSAESIASGQLSKGLLMPLHGKRRGTKQHYWLHTMGKKASWRVFQR